MKKKHIAILDFGSQYMHLISRRIRQLGVLTKIYPTDVNVHDLKDAVGVIISGGPNSVNDQKLAYDPGLFDMDVPVLGLCYGHQLMAHHLGGVVTPAHNREYGKATITIAEDSPLFAGLEKQEPVWMSHWDSVTAVPEGFQVIAKTDDCPVAGMANEKTKRYGLQFHPEVHHSTHGQKILENFVLNICKAEVNWSMAEYIEQLTSELKEFVGEKKVFLLVSGGVDSTVAFALLEKILGKKRVYGLHIDNGFMRLNESQQVQEALNQAGFDDLQIVDESERFLKALEGIAEPEEKRKCIGKVFLEVQKDVFEGLDFDADEWLLGQGTIYPDTIESGGTKTSDTIKTHHNRVDEIIEMINAGKIVEPLSELYKDEVRDLGRQLALPESLLNRWPFPGPGLAIRVLCSDGTQEAIPDEKRIQQQLSAVTSAHGLTGAIIPLKSVGVQGDNRSYQHSALLYGDGNAAQKDWSLLNELSVTITNGIMGINRVVMHCGGDILPENMQVKKGYVTADRLDLLRKADAAVHDIVAKHGLYHDIWQFPVILLPLSFGTGETVVLRPIESQEAMTVNFYPMDPTILQEIVDMLLVIPGIDTVLYDITNKPPATIEWE